MPSTEIIVIGASSGGVEALQTLVRGLSPDLRAAVLIVLHVGAHPSILPEILQQVTTLPVSHAIDDGSIENGKIYVAPPDHHLILSAGHVHVSRGPKENNARPSVNTLFRTAAAAYGKRVAGIVLTGSLNDGTVGLWEIKRHGGTTIVQDPAEAPYPSMPQSALDSVRIDYVLKVAEMAPLLSKLARGSNLEVEMETRPKSTLEGAHFNGLTCPECRGPLWEQPQDNPKEVVCRVGHRYSFESLLEQHVVTTERSLWTALLAVEEEVILAQRAAQHADAQETRQGYERQAQRKKSQAALIREMLTQPDPAFIQQPQQQE